MPADVPADVPYSFDGARGLLVNGVPRARHWHSWVPTVGTQTTLELAALSTPRVETERMRPSKFRDRIDGIQKNDDASSFSEWTVAGG